MNINLLLYYYDYEGVLISKKNAGIGRDQVDQMELISLSGSIFFILVLIDSDHED